jgi:hypothetical protein
MKLPVIWITISGLERFTDCVVEYMEHQRICFVGTTASGVRQRITTTAPYEVIQDVTR